MTQNKFAEIIYKREQLFQAEKMLPHLQELLTERAHLERESIEIKRKISHLLYQHSAQHQSQLIELKNHLNFIAKKIRQIDVDIDQEEEYDLIQLKEMRQYLYHSIWTSHADDFESQKILWEEVNSLRVSESHTIFALDLIQELLLVFHNIRHTRQAMRGKGILSYIFGTSPNAIIEKSLLYMHDLIATNQTQLENHLFETPQHEICVILEKFNDMICQLKTECKKVWGFQHIDTTIVEYEHKLMDLHTELRSSYEQLVEEIKSKEAQLENWLKEIN